jgi:hypothetical protein
VTGADQTNHKAMKTGNGNIPDRKALEALWRERLQRVRMEMDVASSFANGLRREGRPADSPSPDGGVAYRQAVRAEAAALAEYARILRLFADLVLAGKIPDESEWPPGSSAGGPNR